MNNKYTVFVFSCVANELNSCAKLFNSFATNLKTNTVYLLFILRPLIIPTIANLTKAPLNAPTR